MLPAHHASGRDEQRGGRGQHGLCRSGNQRPRYAIALLALCLILLSGCKQILPSAAQPETIPTFTQVEQRFIAGDLPRAQQAAEAASAHYAATNPVLAASFRVELAKIYLYQGRSADAASLLTPQLPARTAFNTSFHRQLFLAMAYIRLGQPAMSAQALAEAEALHPTGLQYAEMMNIKGAVALEQRSLDTAGNLLQQALVLARQEKARFLEMEVWMNLGVVALQLEHYDDALQSFQTASTLAQSIGARLAREKALGNLGWTYYLIGDDMRALENARAARTEAATIGATLDEVAWLTNAGQSQFRANKPDAARDSYELALTLAQSLHNTQEILDAHISLAYLLLRQQPAQAETHIREAERLAVLRNHPEEQLEPQLLQALWLIKQGQVEDATHTLLSLIPRAKAEPHLQWEAENTLAGLYERGNHPHEAVVWFQRAIATFHHQRLSLKSVELELPFLGNGSGLYFGYMEHLIHQNRPIEALRVLDNSRAETLADSLGSAQPVSTLTDPRTLAARLHGTIFVYCLRRHISYLWVITAHQTRLLTLSGSETILPLVERHNQAILSSRDLLIQPNSTGRQLYDALVAPAASLLPSSGKVFLIADQSLGGLNFETLIPPGPHPHYWIEDVTVTNARSLRLLSGHAPHPEPSAKQRLLLIGDPVYPSQEYPALPHAAAEVAQVSADFPDARRTVVTGAAALPAAYAAHTPAEYAYIHFVAHATANQTDPLDSAIILSTPADDAPNKLYARDILEHPLHADLVTLSSCYGSGVRRYSGEGVVGLVWAFLRAGAHAVIGAMWEVSDLSTPQLMNALYGHLLAGNTPDEALREAKLTLLHGNGVFRKPIYWAAFQLYTGR